MNLFIGFYLFSDIKNIGTGMKIVNKVAILISWPRELDMFSKFIENIMNDVIFVVDDFTYTQNDKLENTNNIIKLLDNKRNYVLLSEVLNKVKYRILISTAQTFKIKITYRSYFKYLYAISLGNFIHYSGLSKFFLKIVGRPLTASGRYAKKFGRYQVEKKIGIKVIKYPIGLDLSKVMYPQRRWKDVFDVYLCHSHVDQDLITNRFPNAKCIKIGYPRYGNTPSVVHSKKIIYNEVDSIDPSKPLLLWMPTSVNCQGESIDNIKIWSPIIEKLLDKYNVLIRPHPKSVTTNPRLASDLIRLGFIVDLKKDRDLGILYQSADLVLADYGGSVLSAVYMKKKLILLNIHGNSKYLHWRKKRMYIDDDIRESVDTFDVKNGISLIEQIDINIQDNNKLKQNKLKEQYFGDEHAYEDVGKIFSKLVKELRI